MYGAPGRMVPHPFIHGESNLPARNECDKDLWMGMFRTRGKGKQNGGGKTRWAGESSTGALPGGMCRRLQRTAQRASLHSLVWHVCVRVCAVVGSNGKCTLERHFARTWKVFASGRKSQGKEAGTWLMRAGFDEF